MAFATNPGNLSLQVTDLLDAAAGADLTAQLASEPPRELELEVERTSAA
jgi:hypothetical protein